MSTSYKAAMVYGLPYDLANSLIDNLNDLIDEGELETFAPYYDATRSDSLVGIQIISSPDYGYREAEVSIHEEDSEQLESEGKALEAIFGEENLKIYLTTVGH